MQSLPERAENPPVAEAASSLMAQVNMLKPLQRLALRPTTHTSKKETARRSVRSLFEDE